MKFTKLEKNDNDQKNDQNDHFCETCVLDKAQKIHMLRYYDTFIDEASIIILNQR